MAKRLDAEGADLDRFKSGHALLAYIYETQGKEGLANLIESLGYYRDRLEDYCVEWRKRNMMELADFVAELAKTRPYYWDDLSKYPPSSDSDPVWWAADCMRRHHLYLLSPAEYQQWIKGPYLEWLERLRLALSGCDTQSQSLENQVIDITQEAEAIESD